MDVLKNWRDRRERPWNEVYYDALRRWRSERGPERLRDHGALPAGGTVFDLGGNDGAWTDAVIARQPDCTVHLFEPHPGRAARLRAKYRTEDRVKVYDYALGSAEGKLPLPEASVSGVEATVDVVAARRFFDTFDIPRIDLMKMNIGGAEYDLLPALAETGVAGRIVRMQLRFHLTVESQIAARDQARRRLATSHDCHWAYPFIWEEWRLRDTAQPSAP